MPCLNRYVNLKTPLAGRWTKVKCRRLYSTVRALWGWNQSKHNCLWEERKTLVQKIRTIFQPIRFKIKTTTWSPTFSRASGSLRVATLSSHWPLLTFLAVWLAFMISLVLAPKKRSNYVTETWDKYKPSSAVWLHWFVIYLLSYVAFSWHLSFYQICFMCRALKLKKTSYTHPWGIFHLKKYVLCPFFIIQKLP